MSSLRDLVLNESVEALAREFKAKPGTVNSKIGMVRKNRFHKRNPQKDQNTGKEIGYLFSLHFLPFFLPRRQQQSAAGAVLVARGS